MHPGPLSATLMTIELDVMSAVMTPPYACAMALTSASYSATTTLFIIDGFTLSCFNVFFIELEADPALTKSPSMTVYSKCIFSL